MLSRPDDVITTTKVFDENEVNNGTFVRKKCPGVRACESNMHVRNELTLALKCLQKAEEVLDDRGLEETSVQTCCNERLEFALDQNKILSDRITELEDALLRERKKNEQSSKALNELQDISGRLQVEVLEIDKEKLRLMDIVKKTQEENEVLGKVMEKISCDYEELKVKWDKSSSIQRDDKIKAYRSTARALEQENALLLQEKDNVKKELEFTKEKSMQQQNDILERLDKYVTENEDLRREISAKDEERAEFLKRFERLETEKINVMRQLVVIEQENEENRMKFQNISHQRDVIQTDRTNIEDTLTALREGKRVVEGKLQNVLRDNASLSEQVQVSETRAASLEDRVSVLEREMAHKVSEVRTMEEESAERTSFYESKMNQMQHELDQRLDEITNSKNVDVEGVKQRYIQLFQEKAEEIHSIREKYETSVSELNESRHRCADLEFRERELQDLVSKTRSSYEEKYRDSIEEVRVEMSHLQSYTSKVETQLGMLQSAYERLQVHCLEQVESLQSRILELSAEQSNEKEMKFDTGTNLIKSDESRDEIVSCSSQNMCVSESPDIQTKEPKYFASHSNRKKKHRKKSKA